MELGFMIRKSGSRVPAFCHHAVLCPCHPILGVTFYMLIYGKEIDIFIVVIFCIRRGNYLLIAWTRGDE